MLTQTDTYKSHVFPAGTIFFANTWAIHHDENEYSEPHKFNPDRWLDNKYGTIANNTTRYESEQRKLTYSWGNGRRICSGQKLAENSLRIVIAKMVWLFDIDVQPGKRKDVDDSPLTAYQGGFLIAPNKFPVRMRPRSDKHAEVVKREFRDMTPFFDKFQTV
jgi:cytochrome P450